MRSWLTVVYSLLLLPLASPGQNGQPQLDFAEQVRGSWTADPQVPNRLLTRLVASSDGQGWWLEVWATRGLKDEAVQKVPLHLLRAGVGGNGPVVRALAVWKEGVGDGEATLYAALRPNDGQLDLELSKVYAAPTHASWSVAYRLRKGKS